MSTNTVNTVTSVYDPWRRYWARMIDSSLYSFMLLMSSVFILKVNPLKSIFFHVELKIIFPLLLMIFVEPLWLHWFGTTPGKWIMGLRLIGSNGQNLNYQDGFIRTVSMAYRGLGFYIPIFSLICLYRSFQDCTDGLSMRWDDDCHYIIVHQRKKRYWLVGILLYVVLPLLSVFLALQGRFMFHHGDQITPEQLAENFNHLSRYEQNGNYMWQDDQGRWFISKEKKHYPYSAPEAMQVTMMEQDGFIQRVEINFMGKDHREAIPYEPLSKAIIDLVTAYVGSQKGYGFIDDYYSSFNNYLPKYWLQPFQTQVGEIEIDYQPDIRNYRAIGDHYFAYGVGSDYHFNLKIIMQKQE